MYQGDGEDKGELSIPSVTQNTVNRVRKVVKSSNYEILWKNMIRHSPDLAGWVDERGNNFGRFEDFRRVPSGIHNLLYSSGYIPRVFDEALIAVNLEAVKIGNVDHYLNIIYSNIFNKSRPLVRFIDSIEKQEHGDLLHQLALLTYASIEKQLEINNNIAMIDTTIVMSMNCQEE